jgi:hypothetical protein
VRSLPLRNIRAQTGLIFFAGLLSLVVITFAISVIVGNTIRVDDARLVVLVAEAASSSSPEGEVEAVEEAAAIRQRRDGNTGMVRGIYSAPCLSSLLFLLIGLWFIQPIIVAPIEALDHIARRIASGDLETPSSFASQYPSKYRSISRSSVSNKLMTRCVTSLTITLAAGVQKLSCLHNCHSLRPCIHHPLLTCQR